MKVKVFYPNAHGKIEFTRQELEKLLDEVYREGQKDCNCSKSLTWTVPYCNTDDLNISATDSTSGTDFVATPNLTAYVADASSITPSKAECVETYSAQRLPYRVNKAELKEAIDSLLFGTQKPESVKINDVFTNLAKELNF